MSKPMGMSVDFQIIRPSQIEDAFYDAVSLAIDSGWSPKQAFDEVRDSWDSRLEEKRREDRAAFKRLESK